MSCCINTLPEAAALRQHASEQRAARLEAELDAAAHLHFAQMKADAEEEAPAREAARREWAQHQQERCEQERCEEREVDEQERGVEREAADEAMRREERVRRVWERVRTAAAKQPVPISRCASKACWLFQAWKAQLEEAKQAPTAEEFERRLERIEERVMPEAWFVIFWVDHAECAVCCEYNPTSSTHCGQCLTPNRGFDASTMKAAMAAAKMQARTAGLAATPPKEELRLKSARVAQDSELRSLGNRVECPVCLSSDTPA